MGPGVIGLEADRRGTRRPTPPAFPDHAGLAQIDVGIGVAGLELDHRTAFGDRLLVLPPGEPAPWQCPPQMPLEARGTSAACARVVSTSPQPTFDFSVPIGIICYTDPVKGDNFFSEQGDDMPSGRRRQFDTDEALVRRMEVFWPPGTREPRWRN